VNIKDEFNGDDASLRDSVKALIELSDDGALAPHSLGCHTRVLLASCYTRMGGMVRIDDPVVTGLVDTLEKIDASGRNHGNDPLTGEACGCESCENYFAIEKALSAYEARVKEVGK
jgi:hypothetical protein